MRKIITAAAALAAILALCSCAAGDALRGAGEHIAGLFAAAEPTETATPEATEQAAEVTNDITIGIYDFDTFDPLNTVSATVRDACGFVFEPLYTYDYTYKPEPVLAESTELSPDGLTLTVHLKQGVFWHDGTELTAADVVYTINRIKGGTANYTELVEPIAGAYAADSYTVILTLSRPVPLAETILSFPIVKNGSSFSNTPDGSVVGTGPFYMMGKSGDDRYTLGAFEQHHGGRAQLDAVYIKMIPDKEKYISLFGANEINTATSESLDMMTYMPKSNAQMTDFISNDMTFIGFNTQSSIFGDAGTRRAVSMLIDRDSIVSGIYFSRAAAADYAINPQSWLNFDTRRKLTSDSAGAEQLLREAGWRPAENGIYYRTSGRSRIYFEVEILVNSDSEQKVKVAEEVRTALRTAGIAASVDECSYDEYIAKINAKNYDLFIGETALSPNGDLTPLVGSAGNYFGYANSEVDALLAQYGTVTDESDIKAVSIALYETVRDESPFAPICFSKKSIVTSAKIKQGVSPSVCGYIRASETWRVK